MKKILLSIAILLGALQVHAVDYLVQTGATGAATWDASVATQTGATIVDLTQAGTTIDAWIAANASGKETWLAAGTYQFAASCTNKVSTVLYGGFAGTETAVSQRAKGDNAWDFTNSTIFNGGSFQMFSGNGQKQLFDGITFQNATFAGNGSIMRVYGNSTIQNCKFENNKGTTAGAQGGALYIYYSATQTTYPIVIKDCYFEANEGGQGGAFSTNSGSLVTITGCSFKNNFVHSTSTASSAGGAVQLQGAGQVIVDRCYFMGNYVDNSNNGAALSNQNSSASTIVSNCVFYKNNNGNNSSTATTPNKHAVYSKNSVLFYNNTLAENAGGCAYMTAGVLKNNVFYGSTSTMAAIDVNYTTITANNNATVNEFGSNVSEGNTIMLTSTNVHFADLKNGDLRPTIGSALIDAGVTLSDDVKTDYVGTARPNGSSYDIGAYEAVCGTLTLAATDGTNYYATFSNVNPVQFADAEVYTANVANGKLTLNEVTDKKVPANTGVLLKTTATSVQYSEIGAISALSDNMLYPASKDKATLSGYTFYMLAYGDAALTPSTLGFYYGAANGAAFDSREGSAYLAVPNTGNASAHYLFEEGEEVATGVDAIDSTDDVVKFMENGQLYIKKNGLIYNALGQIVR